MVSGLYLDVDSAAADADPASASAGRNLGEGRIRPQLSVGDVVARSHDLAVNVLSLRVRRRLPGVRVRTSLGRGRG